MGTERLRFAPEMLARLGEELIPHPDLGVVELARNSYDADAESCEIRLQRVGEAGGTITVTDVGDGMTPEAIRDGFLLLGRSAKVSDAITPRGRRKVGEKGLGRLAALRLGRVAVVRTRPRRELGREYTIQIDWARYDQASAIEDIDLDVSSVSTTEPPGTTIEIRELRSPLSDADVRRLARSLVMLTGPFPDKRDDFKITLDAPEFSELQRVVEPGFFEASSYILRATLDENGQVNSHLMDGAGTVLASGDHFAVTSHSARGVPTGYLAPAAELEIWMFNRSRPSFSTQLTPALRKAYVAWLDEVGGVHFYQRGLRVHPYGDRGYDWLDMNVLQKRNPEERPGTNNSVGRISVVSEDGQLVPKTDRSGFVENGHFAELKDFARASLEWAADVRLQRRDERKVQEKRKTRDKVKETQDKVDAVLNLIPESVRPVVQQAVREDRAAMAERLEIVENDLMLYRTLSTVGTTTAVFAHETLRPVDTIEQMIGSIARRGARELGGERYDSLLGDPVDLIRKSAASLHTFAELPLELLKQRKRKLQNVEVNLVIRELVENFQPYFSDAQVAVSVDLTDEPVLIRSTIASVEAILANFLANSVATFTNPETQSASREVLVRTQVVDEHVVLTVLDSGPGISDISIDDVWKPGKSTRNEGTGMGLTIVRDIVLDLRGRVWAIERGELGGAEFHVSCPRAFA
ncbi:sensor histidine kinase [Streptomyces sp. NPDC049949]|uniref:ATP-binding protein n=1 Tax=Streptomyces sp. NPDC049949 TaxID=3154627 RepID=UPI003434C685